MSVTTSGFWLSATSAAALPTSQQDLLARDATGERIALGPARNFRCYESRTTERAEASSWIQVDLGSAQPIDAVILYPSNKYFMVGNGFPLRFRIECAPDDDLRVWELIADRSTIDYPDPADRIVRFPAQQVMGRYLRVTAMRLRQRKQPSSPFAVVPTGEPPVLLSFAKIAVLSNGQDIAVGRNVTVDPTLGREEDAHQLARAARPQGEGLITDNPGNVTSPDVWRPPVHDPPFSRVHLDGGLFHAAMARNIVYLLESFSTDDLLLQFRERAGKPAPHSRQPNPFWEEELAGSNAGRFLMGAGKTLQQIEHPELRARMNAVVDGIAGCRQLNGYIMAFPEDSMFVSEHGAYTRSWTTHGLIEAGYAGHPAAFGLLRGYYDWYNALISLPELLRGCMQGGQGMVANTRMYFAPLGRPLDVQVIQRYFQENYWIEDLTNGRPEAIWQYPYDRPHVYLLTNLEAYLDLYRATGDAKYLSAVDGAWNLFRDNWQNIGGSFSIIEGEKNLPRAHELYAKLGETCGSAFWILLNQRLNALRPDEEKYVAEIEKSIYNVILANQDGTVGIRYHTLLVGQKEPGRRVNTCCEGQGTRILASLAEHIYTVVADGVYVNLYEASGIEWRHAGAPMQLTMRTSFPRDSTVDIEIGTQSARRARLRIRTPSWATNAMTILINDAPAATGAPGTYTTLDRLWTAGDRISFVLPMGLKLTKYTGADQVAGHERFALEYGPLLMAAIGAADSQLLLLGADRPTHIIGRLQRDSKNGCHFNAAVLGAEVKFIPYFEVTNEAFSCFPIIDTRSDLL